MWPFLSKYIFNVIVTFNIYCALRTGAFSYHKVDTVVCMLLLLAT